MNINLEVLLRHRIAVERIVTKREAMLAANAAREHRGEVQAYPEEAFVILDVRLGKLETALDAAGEER